MKFSEQDDKLLRDNYLTIPAKRMAKMLGRCESAARQRMKILGIVVPAEIIAKFKKDSQIKKGNTPFNKGLRQVDYMSAEMIEATASTRFKPGTKPPNTKPQNGIVTVRTDKRTGIKYQYIKLGDADWKELHRYNWENMHGPIPEGYCVVFKDRNNLNADPSNLELIKRSELMERNTIHRYPVQVKEAIRTLGKLNKTIQKHEKQD